ncbi:MULTISPECIES: cytochrome c1 [Stutzerimonas stutzeri subgroup]|jgi:ubiquinol-cytochrome c reductase cytochrome c1 subunit|uniref:cytochrome c1 n=1 Tax=Stutzerimonas stutzeri subgroup TaxID=578833 RepID=UPI0017464542|nr:MULTISPECIES: cytochrome c1 [Stutzerimonas stutzeri subgroup]MBD3876527.1 cytochrome c1 [Stutzerimonas kunmingensis]UIP31801.1 cytochrome c1 [Stutzerimonas kunmingensis]
MKKQFAALILAILPVFASAAGTEVHLDKVDIDLTDKAAMQDGLKTFANYCMGCHSAQYQRYERVATDLGIPEEVMMDNIVFADAKFGDHMKIGMKADDAKVWFGAAPPDLTLVARVRGNDWLYTYMRSFYEDPARPYGVNNTVFPNVGMPHVLAPLQGRRVVGCKQVQVVEDGRKQFDPLTGTPITEEACDQMVVEPGTGTLSEAEYDEKIKNLVTFLAYSANPVKLESQRIGTYVLLFLAVFFVFAYLLKREYWKDVH